MKKLLLLFLFILTTVFSYGSHIAGGEITYEYVGTPNNPNRYKINLILIRDNRSSAMVGGNINYTSSCHSGGTFTLPKVPGGTGPNGSFYFPSTSFECVSNYDSTTYEMHIFSGEVDLPTTCVDWRFSHSLCCRNAVTLNIQNPSSNSFYIEAVLNNTKGHNDSPYFIDPLAKGFCINPQNPLQWKQRSVENEGDSTFLSFGQPLDNWNSPVNFNTGYSKNAPISSSTPISIDNSNSTIYLSPDLQGEYVVKLTLEEYRYDTVNAIYYHIGSISREIIVPVTINCSPNSYNPSISSSLNDTIGTPVILNCGDSILRIYTNLGYDHSTLAPNGTDFVLYRNNSLIPIIAAKSNPASDRQIDLALYKAVDFNDTLYLVSRTGFDMNTIINNCGIALPSGDSIMVVFQGCSGVGLEDKVVKLTTVSPNPFTGEVKVNLLDYRDNIIYNLRDNSGRLIQSGELDPQFKEHIIHLEKLSSGIYHLSIQLSGLKPENHIIFKN